MISEKEQYEFYSSDENIEAGYPLKRLIQNGGQNIESLYIPLGHVISSPESSETMGGGKYSSSVMQQAMNRAIKPLDDWMYDQLFENVRKPTNPTNRKSLKTRDSKNKTAKK
jgi:hypothetical protein